jgi:hypothetical protein
MNPCNEHEKYATRPEAFAAMVELIARAKRTGRGGKSWRRLNVFPCGDHWHVGRARTNPKGIVNKRKPEKLITFGEARRKLARLDRDLERTVDYCIRKRVELATRLIELDRARGEID